MILRAGEGQYKRKQGWKKQAQEVMNNICASWDGQYKREWVKYSMARAAVEDVFVVVYNDKRQPKAAFLKVRSRVLAAKVRA